MKTTHPILKAALCIALSALLAGSCLLTGCSDDDKDKTDTAPVSDSIQESSGAETALPEATGEDTTAETTEYKPTPEGGETTIFDTPPEEISPDEKTPDAGADDKAADEGKKPAETVTTAPPAPAGDAPVYDEQSQSGTIKSNTGTTINLRVEWQASSVSAETLEIKCGIWLDFIRLKIVDPRICNLTVKVGDQTFTEAFATGKIWETESVWHNLHIGDATFTANRDPNKPVSISITAGDWVLGGNYGGKFVGEIKASGKAELPALKLISGNPQSPPSVTTAPNVSPDPPKTEKPAETKSLTPTSVPEPADLTLKGDEALNMKGTFSSATGTMLNLRVEWTAVQQPSDTSVAVTAVVWLDYVRLNIPVRQGTITINGYTQEFTTGIFKVNENKSHSYKFTTLSVTIPRTPGEDTLMVIDVNWHLGGTYNGIPIDDVEASASVILSERYSLMPQSYQLPVTYISQQPELPNGCEITSLAILLNYMGYAADKLDLSDNYLPKGKVGEVSYYEANVGNPRDVESYGCHSPVIVKAANDYFAANGGLHKAVDLTGHSIDEIYCELTQGNPVIMWITLDMARQPTVLVSWEVDGETYNWKHPQHCAVLSGYNKKTGKITYADPLLGRQEVDRATFELRWRQMGSQAVTVHPAGENAAGTR